MIYLKNKDGEVFAYETVQEAEAFGGHGLVVMTPDEVSSHLNPAPTTEQLVSEFRASIQRHLDAAAVTAGYDDIKTAVTYAEEPAVPKFQAEGQAFRAWRSVVWDYSYAQLDAVLAGEREQPTIEAFLAELPALVLPA